MGDRIRLTPAFFSEVWIMPDGSRRGVMPLDRVERMLLERDHEIALLMNELSSQGTSHGE